MARSELEIERSIRATFAEINPSLDLDVGPTYNYCIRPVPRELASIELEQERITRYYSQDFALAATPTEARAFATNFGLSPNPGGRASTSVIFFRNSPVPAGQTAIVPVGVLVASVDNSLVYRTIESKTMFGDYAQTYFNPSTNKFELEVFVEALNPGIIYNVAPFRITRIMTGQLPYDGIEQRNAAKGGTEAETEFDLAQRAVQQFKGLNLGSVTGIENLARNVHSTAILDIHIIRPTDRLEFRRPASGPSIDMCISGYEYQQYIEEYLATGGERSIPVKQATTVSVSTVRVNGTVLDASQWTFIADSTLEYQGSTRAKPIIEFADALTINDVVEISGTKNNLLNKVQAFFGDDDNALFQTDVLVRSFVDLPIVVSMEIKVKNSPNFDTSTVENNIGTIVASYIEPQLVPGSLSADFLVTQVRSVLPEVDSIKIFEFRRQFKSLDSVEYIVPLKNEIPRYSSVASNIIVRS